MRTFSELNAGDYLRACASLEATPEVCSRIARFLILGATTGSHSGLTRGATRPSQEDRLPLSGSGLRRRLLNIESTEAAGSASGSITDERSSEGGSDSADELPSTLTRLPAATALRPPAFLASSPLADPGTEAPPPGIVPLFPPGQVRAIVSRAVSQAAATGPWDLESVVERCARGHAFTEPPRRLQPTLSAGVQLLVDRSEAMSVYSEDSELLEKAIIRVVGAGKVQVLYFAGFPSRAGVGGRGRWKDYQEQLPPLRTTVAVLTDLGIGDTTSTSRGNALRWHEFAVGLRRRQCPVVVFVPYARRRWPTGLNRVLTLLQWDRSTTASSIQAVIGKGLRVDSGR